VGVRWWGGSVEDSWWETFTTYDGLASDYISAIAVDAQGNAWVGTEYDGLSARRAADGAWTTHHIRNSDLASNDISALAVDAQGDAWCGHNWSGVTFIPQEAGQEPRRTSPWKVFTSEDGLASDEVSVIAVDGQGNAWAGTAYDGLSVRWAADGSWSTYTSEDGLAGYDISAVAVDAPDDVWVGTRYDGLSVRRADDGSWSTYTFEDGLASNYVSALAVDALGNVWVGTEWSGLSVRWAADGYWSTYTTDDGLASDDVSAIAVTPDGDVWVGHPWSGVSRLSGGVWTTYGYETLVSEYVTALAVAPNGAVWVGTEDGISVYTPADDQWTNYPQYDTIWLGDNVAAIAFESDGDTWIGFEQAGTVWVAADLGDWERYTSEERDGPASNYVKDIALDEQGNVWFATPVYGGGGEAYDHRGVGLARPVRQGSGEYGGVTLYRPSTSLVLWSYETEMSAAGQKIVELAVGLTAAELGTTGKLYLEGDLIAQTGQRLDDDRQPFYVFATETALTLSTDKAIYRPDEGVVIGGAVINRSASSLNGQTLTVTLDGDTLYTEGPFDVPAGGSHPYSITTNTPQDPGAVTLAATLGDVVVQDRVTVAEPQVSADVLVPDVVGRAPFSVTVVLNNIGSVDADLVVTVDEGAPHSLALPAGQRNLVKESLTIADDADVAVEITGDLVLCRARGRTLHPDQRRGIGQHHARDL
jgi:sugar lactone lactonase YvrE